MTAWTTWIGGILAATGLIAYFATAMASVTALIPTVVGVLLLIAAFIGRRPGKVHQHAMHAALLIALLGALGSLMNVAKIPALVDGTAERPSAIVVSTIMFVLLAFYLGVGIRSFVAARRSRAS